MATRKKGKKGAKRIGRPPEPVPAGLADEVIEWIEQGKPMAEWCRLPGKVTRRTVHLWREKDEAFATRFARARDDGYDEIADDCLAIADDGSNDWMERTGKDGESLGWQVNGEHVQRSRLRVDARLKLLAKWCPKKYGDKLAVGGDAAMDPIQMAHPGPPVPSTVDLVAGIGRLKSLADELLGDDQG